MSGKPEAVFRYSERGSYGLIEQADGHVTRISGVTLEQFKKLQAKFLESHGTRGCPFSSMHTPSGYFTR